MEIASRVPRFFQRSSPGHGFFNRLPTAVAIDRVVYRVVIEGTPDLGRVLPENPPKTPLIAVLPLGPLRPARKHPSSRELDVAHAFGVSRLQGLKALLPRRPRVP